MQSGRKKKSHPDWKARSQTVFADDMNPLLETTTRTIRIAASQDTRLVWKTPAAPLEISDEQSESKITKPFNP